MKNVICNAGVSDFETNTFPMAGLHFYFLFGFFQNKMALTEKEICKVPC
jgi:hypothetical protein